MENTKKINKNSKIGVLCGGLSNEREVSLRSGRNVFKALIELGYKDVTLIDVDRNIATTLSDTKIEYAFIVLHGRYGEDGCIQGVLEFLNIPYTGCNVMASAICMDKIMTKKVLSTNKEIPLIKSENATSKEEAIILVEQNKEKFREIALNTVKENGYNYDVKINIGNFQFPTKNYKSIIQEPKNRYWRKIISIHTKPRHNMQHFLKKKQRI